SCAEARPANPSEAARYTAAAAGATRARSMGNPLLLGDEGASYDAAGARPTEFLPEHPPRSGQVVPQGQRNQNSEPEDAAEDDGPRQAGAVFHVHEEEDDYCRLEGSNGERGDGVQPAKVEKCNLHGEIRAEHQDCKNRVIDALWKNVCSHQCPRPPRRYSSGKRKIQTMSTKCQ